MSRFTSWYVVELERLIKGRVPSAQVAETLGEVEAHLTDSTQDLAPTCLHGEDPEALAVERFGPPRRLALELLDAQGRLPYWQTGKWLVLWFAAALAAWVAAIGGPLLAGVPALVHLAFLSSLACFVWTGFKARRVQTKAIACVAGLFFVATSLVLPWMFTFAGGELRDARHLPEGLSDLRAGLARSEKEVAWLDRGIAAFDKGDPAGVPMEFRIGSGFYSLRRVWARVKEDEGLMVDLPPDPAHSVPGTYGPDQPATDLTYNSRAGASPMQSSYAEAREWWGRSAPGVRDELQVVSLAMPGRIADVENAIAANALGRWMRDLPVAFYAASVAWLIAMAIHVGSVLVGRAWLSLVILRRQYA